MTKRSPIKPTHKENQADLFGGAPPSAPLPKKAQAARRGPLSLAKTSQTPQRPGQNTQPTASDPLLNVRQAAARLGLSKSTIDKMRRAGKGPRFIKTTDRAIRYDPLDLDRWINARRSQSD